MVSDVILQKKTLKKLGSAANEVVSAAPSKFAQNHLAKLGWKEGDGLGKKRDGMATHIRVQLKDDNKGIGAKEAENNQFKSTWWDLGFTDALSKLQVPGDSNSKSSGDRSDSDSSDSSDDEDLDEAARLSLATRDLSTYTEEDRKLFIACGGRRCGKRAGQLQTGKMLREKKADDAFRVELGKVTEKNGGDKKAATTAFNLAAREAVINQNTDAAKAKALKAMHKKNRVDQRAKKAAKKEAKKLRKVAKNAKKAKENKKDSKRKREVEDNEDADTNLVSSKKSKMVKKSKSE